MSSSGDFCEWVLDLTETSKEFGKLMITFGQATTSAFSSEKREDDTKIIHGEGYTFYLWYKEEVEQYYDSDEYEQRQNKSKEKDPSKADEEESEDHPFRSREEIFELVSDLRTAVYAVMNQEEYSTATVEPLTDGLLFRISKIETSLDIDFALVNQQYVDKCDQLYESLFNIIEKTFDYEIEDKDRLKIKDHIEGGKVYCASNFYLRPDGKKKAVRLMNDDIVNMEDIEFKQMTINDSKKYVEGLDYTTLPIKNVKVYFEKTQRVDEEGQAVVSGSEDRHMFYTMNFHIFFYTFYGPNQDIEKKMVSRIVDEMESVYCLNFQCEPDLDSGVELNFTTKNENINPEHFMVVNYFKPSYMFEHMLTIAQDSEEIKDENEEASKMMSEEQERRLKRNQSLILL